MLKASQKENCNAKFTLADKFHKRNRKFTNDLHESGGNTTIDFKKHVISEGKTSKGEYDSIHLPRGVVDWHSHPRKCLNDDKCALGIPSPADLGNVALGALYGTKVHMVYSREGTYEIKLCKLKVAKFIKDAKAFEEFTEALHHVFLGIHDKYVEKPYKEYQNEWFKEAKKIGFLVKLWPKDNAPIIEMDYDCALEKQSPKIMDVELPK